MILHAAAILLAVHLGTPTVQPTAAALSVREELSPVSTLGEIRRALFLDRREWNLSHAPEWPVPAAGVPRVGPIFPVYRPEEWISLFASQLLVDHPRITRAARAISRLPLRVDLSPSHFYVAYRFSM